MQGLSRKGTPLNFPVLLMVVCRLLPYIYPRKLS
jgi:hypothetical protein